MGSYGTRNGLRVSCIARDVDLFPTALILQFCMHGIDWSPPHMLRGCCCCTRCQLEQFDGDTCFPNTTVIQDITGVFPENIITASFVNSVWKVPYYAAYDSHNKRLVIALRGTLSLQVCDDLVALE